MNASIVNEGDRCGMLVAVRRVQAPRRSKLAWWLWRCDCGREVTRRSTTVKRSRSQQPSCGCTVLRINKKPGDTSAINQYMREYVCGARERGLSWALNAEEFRALIKGVCFYCGQEPSALVGGSYSPSRVRNGRKGRSHTLANGVDRIDSSLGYTRDNTRSCCKICNYAKGVLTEIEFFNWLKRASSWSRLWGRL